MSVDTDVTTEAPVEESTQRLGPLQVGPVPFLIGLALAVTGPLWRTIALCPAPAPVVVGGAILAAVAISASPLGASTIVRWIATGIAAALVAPFAGIWAAAWTFLAIPLGLWIGLDRRPWRGASPVPLIGLGFVGGISLAAALRGRALFGGPVALGLTVLACVMAWVASRHEARLRRIVDGVIDGIGRVLSAVLFGMLAIITVVLPWCVDRLLFVDPLRQRRTTGSSWVPLDRGDARPAHLWSTTPRNALPGRWARFRSGMSAMILAVAVVAAAAGGAFAWYSNQQRGGLPDWRPEAFAGAEWWPQYQEEMNWAFFNVGRAEYPLRYPGMIDVSSRWVNVRDGERVTWQPPPCDSCPTRTVWMYGGSTTLGIGQRDEHTVASELARAAWADGVRLNVVNRGILGELQWEEAQRFAWDVERQPAPDAVVFLDGFNEIAGAEVRDSFGKGLDGNPVDWSAEATLRDYTDFMKPFRIVPEYFRSTPDGAQVNPRPPVPAADPETLGNYALELYDRGRPVARDAAARHGVEPVWYWQPTRYARPQIEGEPAPADDLAAFRRQAYATARAGLPADVVDLTDIFTVEDGPLFFDDSHSNERAAAITGQAMWADLAPRLDLGASSAPAGP